MEEIHKYINFYVQIIIVAIIKVIFSDNLTCVALRIRILLIKIEKFEY